MHLISRHFSEILLRDGWIGLSDYTLGKSIAIYHRLGSVNNEHRYSFAAMILVSAAVREKGNV
jgi:hypothetical protein